MKDKIILDLCGGTGSWSKPYKDNGYKVINVTLPKFDVKTFNPPKNVYGILAAPPCTMFSLARTRAKKKRDLKEGMEIVRACLNIIWKCMENKQDTKIKKVSLKFWALENPKGMLQYFLGKPTFIFDPYQFGDGYKKKTALWGYFNEPKTKPKVMTKKMVELCKTNSRPLPKFDKLKTKEIHPEYYGKLTRQERRAITPQGFAHAFFKANQ